MFHLDDILKSEAQQRPGILTSLGQLHHLEISYTLSQRPKSFFTLL